MNVGHKKARFYESYVSRLLKNVRENNGVTGNARQQTNSVLCYLTEIIANKAKQLTLISNRRTISCCEVSNAVLLCFPGNLGSDAKEAMRLAVETYDTSKSKTGTSRHTKANLILPPSIPEKFLRQFKSSNLMVTSTAPLSLCAALQIVSSRILSAAADRATANKKIRITVRDLELAVRSDPELDELFRKTKIEFIGGGAVPFIHPLLVQKKIERKKSIKGQKRYKPGAVAVRDIKRMQDVSDKLVLPKAPFECMIRKILTEEGVGSKVSKHVFTVMQYYLESRLVDIMKKANSAAIHAGRIKLIPDDIKFIISLEKGMPITIEDDTIIESHKDTIYDIIEELDGLVEE